MISVKISAMKNRLRIAQNLFGLLLKLTVIPYAVYIYSQTVLVLTPETLSTILGVIFILFGLQGMIISDLLILRFGDGTLHFSAMSARLVDVGLYARTRHPTFWFFSIYLYGILLVLVGFNWLLLFLSLGISFMYLLWLLLIQETLLIRSLGDSYLKYKNNTPFWYWKINIEENLEVSLRPQLVWIIGMLVGRFWYKIKVQGLENIPLDRPFLIVANHESYLDPFLFGIFLPFEVKFVTTADLYSTRLMRFLLKGTGSFPMKRHRQDLKSIRTMIRMIGKGQVVCIFPEGGRTIDGSPLPILNETLKLIQRCKVPILPVHIDGAYEIWPRWAPNRRRGRVITSFKPMIPLEAQVDLTELENRIKTAIFAETKVYRHVKNAHITKGMDHLLWACYKCHARNSICVISGHSVKCQACQSEWQVSNDYAFSSASESRSLSSSQWINQIEADILDYPLYESRPYTPEPDETIHLHTPIQGYVCDDEVFKGIDLSLALSNQKMTLIQNDAPIRSWPLASITIFTMDYYNAVSIGVGGVRHSFKLPANEIALKWQTYFDTLVAKYQRPRSNIG